MLFLKLFALFFRLFLKLLLQLLLLLLQHLRINRRTIEGSAEIFHRHNEGHFVIDLIANLNAGRLRHAAGTVDETRRSWKGRFAVRPGRRILRSAVTRLAASLQLPGF